MGLSSETPATAFGYAVHKALEHWYALPFEEREFPAALKEYAEQLAYGHKLEVAANHGAVEAIRQFVIAKYDILQPLGDADKRSLQQGVKILIAYFKHYAKDRWVVAWDDAGPIVEREIEFKMFEDDDLVINYFGTIDVVLENLDTGLKMPADHKTTSSLGTEFYQRCKPNPQYRGYSLAAREVLGIESNLFMVNGIQVAKAKNDFARQIVSHTEEDYQELRNSVVHSVRRWLKAGIDHWPQSAPNPCTMYGGCQFLCACEVPEKLRKTVIGARWPGALAA